MHRHNGTAQQCRHRLRDRHCVGGTPAAASVLRRLARGEDPGALLDEWRAIPGQTRYQIGADTTVGSNIDHIVKGMVSGIPESFLSQLLPSMTGPLLTVIESEISD